MSWRNIYLLTINGREAKTVVKRSKTISSTSVEVFRLTLSRMLYNCVGAPGLVFSLNWNANLCWRRWSSCVPAPAVILFIFSILTALQIRASTCHNNLYSSHSQSHPASLLHNKERIKLVSLIVTQTLSSIWIYKFTASNHTIRFGAIFGFVKQILR